MNPLLAPTLLLVYAVVTGLITLINLGAATFMGVLQWRNRDVPEFTALHGPAEVVRPALGGLAFLTLTVFILYYRRKRIRRPGFDIA